jgi:hypothetical protein
MDHRLIGPVIPSAGQGDREQQSKCMQFEASPDGSSEIANTASRHRAIGDHSRFGEDFDPGQIMLKLPVIVTP